MRKSDSRDKVSPVPFTSAPSGTRTRSDALQAGRAHDFNNQLQALSGFADFVARDPGLSGRSRHDLLEVKKSAERMASLTRQLLAFSRSRCSYPRRWI